MAQITLHELRRPHITIEVDSDKIVDIKFASFGGGSILTLVWQPHEEVSVDENPNHVSLMAGFIEGRHICTGSRSGMYDYYHQSGEI